MKKIFITLMILTPFLLTSCGGEREALSLEGKKRQLQQKKSELKELSKTIAELEAEIQEQDPTLKAEAKVAPVVIKELQGETFKHFVNVQGMVEANKNITVSPMVAGRLVSINVREGQSVRSNQVLAQIDDAVLRSSIEEIKTQLDLAKIVFEKQERLWKQEIGTEIQYLTAKNNKEALDSRLATLKEQLNMNKIKAPIAGSVDEIVPKIGEMVSPGFPAFRIVNANDLSITAEVPEAYAPFIQRGKEVNVTFPILDKSIKGKVTLVGQSINPINRSFRVEVKLPNSKEFKPNMFGEISVNDRTLENTIAIPLNMVQKSDVGSFVYVAKQQEENWVAERTNIQLGLISKDMVQITSGLKAGDKIITVGYKELSNGQLIRPETSVATN